jgi:hypothetical protein
MQQQCQNMDLMSPREKRMAIAKDIIQQIKYQQLNVSRGLYVAIPGEASIESTFDYFDSFSNNDQINQILINSGVVCQVCARGAIFIAGLKRFNNLTVGDFRKEHSLGKDIYSSIRETYERNFFEPQQLSLIERAFEKGAYPMESRLSVQDVIGWEDYERLCEACILYSLNLSEPDLLIKIANNIIRNNGDFIIPRKYWRQAGVSDKISGGINNELLHKVLI